MTLLRDQKRVPGTAHVEAPLERDTDRDCDLSNAAVSIFGIVGLAVVALTGTWLYTRGTAPQTLGFEPHAATESMAVAADAPMLQLSPEGEGHNPASFTLLDDATGTREVVDVSPRPGATPGNPVLTR